MMNVLQAFIQAVYDLAPKYDPDFDPQDRELPTADIVLHMAESFQRIGIDPYAAHYPQVTDESAG